jgi:osmoprotectant transport system ATP-binding protein
MLVIDGNGAPLGWIDTDGLRRHRAGAPLSETMAGVGALLRPDGNLSQALDCALSSPAAMGVAVDNAGKVVGGVLASDVLAALDSRKAEGRA